MRCGTCDNCRKLEKVKAPVLANCGTPRFQGGQFRGQYNHADDGVVAVWNDSLKQYPCAGESCSKADRGVSLKT